MARTLFSNDDQSVIDVGLLCSRVESAISTIRRPRWHWKRVCYVLIFPGEHAGVPGDTVSSGAPVQGVLSVVEPMQTALLDLSSTVVREMSGVSMNAKLMYK